jgi:hypothetical protein
MKKYAISNYYDNIETYLDDSSKDNTKLYWKLMKDSFNMKLSNEIPPIQVNDDTEDKKVVYSDSEKIEVLNAYFSSISDIKDNKVTLPHMYSLSIL